MTDKDIERVSKLYLISCTNNLVFSTVDTSLFLAFSTLHVLTSLFSFLSFAVVYRMSEREKGRVIRQEKEKGERDKQSV